MPAPINVRSFAWLALAALLLSASHSLPCAAAAATPATKTSAEAESERQASVARRLENALARKLLRQAAELLPYVQQTGLGNIQRKLEQFDQAVDEAMLTGEVRRQGELLTHLVKTHEVSRDFSAGDASFAQLVSQLASVLVSLPDMRDELKEEATRLDAAISANASAAGSTKTTAAKTFPNTYEGRQAYLDQLQGALFKGQMQWYDILTHYDESDLAVTGTESADTPFAFRYLPDEGALLVNLSDMGRLPAFELGGLAIIYGFPGVHTLYGRVPADGLQRQMQLPGVS
ncbi:MAG: hypothetical protein ACR2PJ_03755, partial [Pseudomonadales bacterium]